MNIPLAGTIVDHGIMRIRYHRGFGHGIRPGQNRDINCRSCRREDDPRTVTMPATPWCDLPPDDAYAWGCTLGGAIRDAGQGVTTELHWPDGTVAALITPPGGPS